MLDARKAVANALHAAEVLLCGADDGCSGMVDDVSKVVSRESIVDRHEDRAYLRHGVERFQLLMDVGRDVGDAIARGDAQPLEHGRPPVATLEELLVGQPQVAVDDRLALRMQSSSPSHELEWRERRLHRAFLLRLPGFAPSLDRLESYSKNAYPNGQKPNRAKARCTARWPASSSLDSNGGHGPGFYDAPPRPDRLTGRSSLAERRRTARPGRGNPSVPGPDRLQNRWPSRAEPWRGRADPGVAPRLR